MSRQTRFAYLIPMSEANRDSETLAWARKRGETFEAYLMDERGQFDSAFYATRDEAYQGLRALCEELAWDWATVQFSIDE